MSKMAFSPCGQKDKICEKQKKIAEMVDVFWLIFEPQRKCPVEGFSRPLKDSQTHTRWMQQGEICQCAM